MEVLPCGCVVNTVIVEGRNEFQMTPCNLYCKNFQYALYESERWSKPIEIRKAP